MDVPSGTVILWLGSAASIPTGWTKYTSAVGRIARGTPTGQSLLVLRAKMPLPILIIWAACLRAVRILTEALNLTIQVHRFPHLEQADLFLLFLQAPLTPL